MKEEALVVSGEESPLFSVHTLVIGSGAAGLNAAIQLRANGVDDVLIVTEGLDKGTSFNTGSDKQTYYKLAVGGDDVDSPMAMARDYYAGGGMHGDIALVEASVSARAFMHLVNLGVPFPRDRYGQFVGYKTDHDARQRATSVGPYTSREMCRALARRVSELGVPVRTEENVVALATVIEEGRTRVAGAIAVRSDGTLVAYCADNVVLAVGGPGGLYRRSVYPEVHTGAIGLALMVGAQAQNLPDSQFGLASVRFRWNVSGSFMQVVPRFFSTAPDGRTDVREFLDDFFGTKTEAFARVFLKGYQWPFDAAKVAKGSSLIDVLVHRETEIEGRRVFLDYRRNPDGFSLEALSHEAFEYLRRSHATGDTPYERLQQMNPAAIGLYRDHEIDISREPLEIAVCAQHNNGGLTGTIWWESPTIRHLFPVGEVNGSHGVYRPGGSALNAGQVGGFRAAEYIANRYSARTLEYEEAIDSLAVAVADIRRYMHLCERAGSTWQHEREEYRRRMSCAGAMVRSVDGVTQAVKDAWTQWRHLEQSGCSYSSSAGLIEALRNRHLCFAHAVYLEAILFALNNGVGSRGSSLALESGGTSVHVWLSPDWQFRPEDLSFRDMVLETVATTDGAVINRWVTRRPLPESDAWFETDWARFRNGQIYEER